jgi:hypothetical protein
LAQKWALRVIDLLAHPGYRCIGTCHLRVRKVQRQRIKDKGTKTKDKGTRIKDKE